MNKTSIVAIVAISLLLLVVGCAKSSPEESNSRKDLGLPGRPEATTATATATAPQPGPGGGEGAGVGQGFSGDRMIIRNATVDIEVENVLAGMEKLGQIATQAGGLVVSSKTFGEAKKLSGAITIRVPFEAFDQTIRAIRSMAFKLVNEDISTRDVSEEFVDLQSRLRNLEATEQQLLKLMQQATTVDAALNVQRELTRVRGDIEQTRGRMQFLQQSSATSLISVNMKGSALTPEFVASTTEVQAGGKVAFRDSSSGGTPPYSYLWSFGDGATSDLKNPEHVYKKAGTFTVALTLVDDKGVTATETKKAYILVRKVADWSFPDTVTGAWSALAGAAKVVATLAVYLLFLSPIWGGVAAIAILVARRARKRKAKL